MVVSGGSPQNRTNMIILPTDIQYRLYNAMKGLNTSLLVYLTILAGMVVFGSCEEKKEAVLSEKEMVQVLTEIYIAEDKVNRMSLDPDSSKKVFDIMMVKISHKTGVSDSVFKKSLEYYSSRPKEMEKIYTALVDSLNLKEQRSSAGRN
jgi:hypothetical protein